MNNHDEIQDYWGSTIEVSVVPGDNIDPQFVQVTTVDSTITIVSLTLEQTQALINALTDAIGGAY